MIARQGFFLSLLVLAPIASIAAPGAPRIGAGARIQAAELGPGWHHGFFNQLRLVPPCYLVMIFAPRESSEEPLRVQVTVPAARITRLQVTSAPGSSMQEWGGLRRQTAPEDSWRDVDLVPLLPAPGQCLFEEATDEGSDS